MAARAGKKLRKGPRAVRKGAIRAMQVKVVIHEAEEGGFWAEVPALPGCVSQGESMDELLANVREAIQAWLATEPPGRGGGRGGRAAQGGRAEPVKPLSGKQFCRLLERNGWSLL